MNGHTAKVINRYARLVGKRARVIKRDWRRANKLERAKMRGQMQLELTRAAFQELLTAQEEENK